jgi:hypothetical protein
MTAAEAVFGIQRVSYFGVCVPLKSLDWGTPEADWAKNYGWKRVVMPLLKVGFPLLNANKQGNFPNDLRDGSGNLNSRDKWIFRATAA